MSLAANLAQLSNCQLPLTICSEGLTFRLGNELDEE